jgi:hypothetical protein
MTTKTCLNCGKDVSDKYCAGCGQKTNTHRISFKHFLFHDLLHGTFHIEKGMLFTAKQALVRPGKAALEYIAGKRVNYYNVFYFILVLLGLNILLTHYYNQLALEMNPERALVPSMNEAGEKINSIFSRYGKLLFFFLVPLTALNSHLIFKRKKLFYSEHFILSGILLLGVLLLLTFALLFSFVEFLGISSAFIDGMRSLLPYFILLYFIYGYYNAFRADYKLPGFSWRFFLFLCLCVTELFLLFMIITGIATGWDDTVVIEYTF